ncbi:MAG: exodeoxyribonuclease VII small subunit [Candidatus Omnitrophica bacterium CG07_land_8_20_14_0_80_42_15]|uniref:Exodeoxyribonuclease 7 small subunit n=1 Tax=Candidatus Aquitaenariimonas noxiae TaxID=1974741 RepID=A0A2J0KSQ3_9BACT|nr:MAG: exodeoxyribonuclease VII small subunit [Candidatus Omnitrophica bacterium CG07_land_8_20_14_0_80_42_15]
MAEQNFEKALSKLEKIVEELESGDLPLDEALKKYEEGVRLAGFCSKKLETAQKKVEILIKTDKRGTQLEPFDGKKVLDSDGE